MAEKEACGCTAAPTLVFACSGAADVGEIADRAARALAREGAGKMFCLAGVGGRISGIMATTQAAEAMKRGTALKDAGNLRAMETLSAAQQHYDDWPRESSREWMPWTRNCGILARLHDQDRGGVQGPSRSRDSSY